MTDKQIKLDGSWIPIEEAIKAGLISEYDIKNKQIIIDDVDVSGCGYYDANADKESHFLHDCKKEHAPCWSCASMPSCLYKKYKRKEQECERLKSTLKVIADRPCLNINDCNGNCLPHCKWNAHKLAQEALKELE